ncbi:hypothetical protein QVD17_19810 [Tagetes erecta]|uniref:Uncharacterized protein n=1 Tax=Tagetes erecta TaxID=13708 RepID=A0AAD8KRK9_TARER|nr:hypothetical protein QVD17_19810 [Tagetes erecta]
MQKYLLTVLIEDKLNMKTKELKIACETKQLKSSKKSPQTSTPSSRKTPKSLRVRYIINDSPGHIATHKKRCNSMC